MQRSADDRLEPSTQIRPAYGSDFPDDSQEVQALEILEDVTELSQVRYSPIIDRPPLKQPNDARLAFWIANNVSSYELFPPPNRHRQFWTRVPQPDVMGYGLRDYGNRVGFWRLLELFDHYALRPSVSLNLAVLDQYPEISDAMLTRDWSIFSHGIYNTRFLFGMTREEEQVWVQENLDTFRRHTGRALKGMVGPAGSLTLNSMELWAEAGITYAVDWFLDDQPFPINVKNGSLVNVPYSWEVNDARTMGGIAFGGVYEADQFLQICKDQFDTLYSEGADSGRVMCMALHPYIIRQAWRIKYLDEALRYILSHADVWVTSAEAIADYYLAHYYDAALEHLAGSDTTESAARGDGTNGARS